MIRIGKFSMPARTFGVSAILFGALCGSSVGLLVRLVETADGWQILFYRSVSFAIMVFLFMVGSNRHNIGQRFRAIGVKGCVVAICLGSAFIAYIFSLLLTTVANAVFILSASPFLAALMARVFLGEKVTPIAWLCMSAALAGVGIMLADGLLSGTPAGSAVALIAAAGYAASIVAFRAGREIDMIPATCLAGVFAAFISAFLVKDFVISGNDLTAAILLGTVQIGLQYIAITIASRYVPAAEVTLLMLLEVVAAPVWVWIAFGETPALLTLIGGSIVLAAVVVQALAPSKDGPRDKSGDPEA